MQIRGLTPDDYAPIIAVVDAWWGRTVASMLPKLFFVHFHQASFVAEDHGERIGFVVGFLSPALPDEAYIHFVGVNPDYRGRRVGRELYERFFQMARGQSLPSPVCDLIAERGVDRFPSCDGLCY